MFRSAKLRELRSALTIGLLCLSTVATLGQEVPLRGDSNPSDKTPITQQQKEDVLSKVNDVIEKSAFVPGVDFAKWPTFLAAERADIDKSETQKEFSMAVNKALHKFGFSHIVLITPEAAQARSSEKSVGIGVLLQLDTEGLRVLNVFPDSPAADAGFQAGDLIILGNGKKPQSPLDLQGEENTALNVR